MSRKFERAKPAALRDTIQRVHESYLRGASRLPSKVVLDQHGSTPQQELFRNVEARVGSSDLVLLGICTAAYSRGLEAAREGRFMEACRHLGDARAIQESPNLSQEAQVLAKAFLFAAEAYMEYRCGNHEKARRRLLAAIVADQILEDTYGYKLLHAHRLHLINNLVRIEAQQGNLELALEMSAHLASYMQGTSADAPAPGSWGRSYCQALPRNLIDAKLVETMGEIGQALAGWSPQEGSRLFEIIEKKMPIRNPELWHPLAYQWFSTKRAFFMESIERYLEMASDYLQVGVTEAPALWRLVALDVVVAAETVPFPESLGLRRDILRDAAAWKTASMGIRSVALHLSSKLEKDSLSLAHDGEVRDGSTDSALKSALPSKEFSRPDKH